MTGTESRFRSGTSQNRVSHSFSQEGRQQHQVVFYKKLRSKFHKISKVQIAGSTNDQRRDKNFNARLRFMMALIFQVI